MARMSNLRTIPPPKIRPTAQKLLEVCGTYMSPERVEAVQQALDYATSCHQGQLRLSGEAYIEHPLETALLVATLRLDTPTLQAALLHDVMEDCYVSYSDLRSYFGGEVARLVSAVTKLGRLSLIGSEDRPLPLNSGRADSQSESLRKMLVAMAQDVRVVLIKLADRLHNMRTLSALSEERRRAIAMETLDIYAPLAHRLGIWEIKWPLEDLAFRFLNPEAYHEVAQLLDSRRDERELFLGQVQQVLQNELVKANIVAEVQGRSKHIYSVYQKMQKYASQGKDFDHIFDLFALRVLVPDVPACYRTLGVIHNLWHPIPGQFDDYIANPKANLYQALHTAVRSLNAEPVEIQIRTLQMHQVAEYGVAAHWSYKEGQPRDINFEEKMTVLRQLLEWQREVTGTEEFLEGVKTDLFRDQVFAYTPKGDLKELPSGATPIDFAYRIHTDLGHRCIGAKVNGRLVSLDYQIQNADTVEILTVRTPRGPNLTWLNPDLGYVHTAHSRGRIRQWFNRQERSTNLNRGRKLLQEELRRLGLSISEVDLAHLMKYRSSDEMLEALGTGIVLAPHLASWFTSPSVAIPENGTSERRGNLTPDIQMLGVKSVVKHIARCCKPAPNDLIVGYITKASGLTLHKQSCTNVLRSDDPHRLVPMNWGGSDPVYPVDLRVDAWDRVGLLRDAAAVVAEDQVNIASLLTEEHSDGTISLFLTLYTTGMNQLSRLLARLERITGVINAVRSTGNPGPVMAISSSPIQHPNLSKRHT